MKSYPGLPVIQTGEYHMIFVQAKDDCASRNQQDYILNKSKSGPAQRFSDLKEI